jgi:hypothetical protein
MPNRSTDRNSSFLFIGSRRDFEPMQMQVACRVARNRPPYSFSSLSLCLFVAAPFRVRQPCLFVAAPFRVRQRSRRDSRQPTQAEACGYKVPAPRNSLASPNHFLPTNEVKLNKVVQAAETDLLTADKWLAVSGPDRPAPIAAAVADIVHQRRK